MKVTRPSVTARLVAAHRARLAPTRPSTPTGDVAGELALYRDVAGSVAVPIGRPTGISQRVAFVDNEVASALGRGVTQVVIVGAGYDGRALRFGGGATSWFELDRPSTQEDKRRRMARLGLHEANVAYGAIDPMDRRSSLSDVLDNIGHDLGRSSLYICEDLFSTLTLEVVASLCDDLRSRAPEGSALASTFLVVPEPNQRGQTGQAIRTGADQLWRLVGERRRSEFYPGDPEKLMVVTGWRVTRSLPSPASRLGQGSHMLALAASPA
jgi:methyltransferase (TIGR00027 family)